MPQMGVSVSEGTITRWLKQVGEEIARDEPLLEISTDKVDTEVPSPGEGVVAEIRVQEGETVEVGSVLAVIAPAGAVPEPAAPEAPPPAVAEETPAAEAPVAAAETPSAPAEPGCSCRSDSGRRSAGGGRRPPRPATGGRSSPRWSRGSPPSTTSTRARSPAPARVAA